MSAADAANPAIDPADIAARIEPDLVALRRHLHQIPELGLDLPLTQQAVLEALAGLDIEITTGEGLSSVVGVIRGRAPLEDGAERRVVLLRGDMDALPVREEVDVAYRSRHEGQMHACGHDLHVAGLVGAARILCERVEELLQDAGIIRNRAKVEAAVANAQAVVGMRDEPWTPLHPGSPGAGPGWDGPGDRPDRGLAGLVWAHQPAATPPPSSSRSRTWSPR